MHRGKVFCIGLSRTGTASLAAALTLLGYPCVHFPHDDQTFLELRSGKFDLTILQNCAGIADTPAVPYYRDFDQVFAGSKFILSLRDKGSWLRSVQSLWELWPRAQRLPYTRFINTAVYGCWEFSAERFSHVYDQHLESVLAYFKARPADLLVFNVFEGDSWAELCGFLGVPVRTGPFPHKDVLASADRP